MQETSRQRRIRVVIADDHAIVRQGIRLLLESQPDMEVVGEAGDGAACLALVERVNPAVVLMDITMPGLDGIQTTRLLAHRCPGVQVVGLTMHENERYFMQMIGAGAAGFVLKGAAPDELLRAVRAAAQGEVYLHPTVARALVADYRHRSAGDGEEPEAEHLTEREVEVLQLIAEGHTAREIGRRLGISVHTVDRHRSNLMSKLDIHSRADLIRYALRRGLISLQ